MNGKEFRTKLRSKEHTYGTMVTAFSPMWPGVLKAAGLDFAFIDTEHIAQNREDLSWMCRLYAANDVTPVVRIPSPDPFEACKVLDGGAQAVIAPYIETAEQVRQLVGAVKYRPLKGQKLQDALSGQTPFEPELKDYLDKRNESNSLIVNIESVAAINALDEILAIEELDAVLIGPHDLSCSLGIPEQWFDARFIAAVDEIISKGHAAGKGAGIHIVYEGGMEQEVRWAKMGANLLVHSIDIAAMRKNLRSEFDELKESIGNAAEGESMETMTI